MAFTGDPAAYEPNSSFEDVQSAGLKLYFGRCTRLHVWQCQRLKNMLSYFGMLNDVGILIYKRFKLRVMSFLETKLIERLHTIDLLQFER
jgi:hypothetical protein